MTAALNWDDLRIVRIVAHSLSLSAAARALESTQPTMSRRLDAFEARIGVRLFDRHPTGLAPTPLCLALIDSLDAMERSAFDVEQRIAARDAGLQGPIIVTSVDWFGEHILAPILTRFCVQHPLVSISLVNDGRQFNLSKGEADLAIRFGKFVQDDLFERKIADILYGAYASEAYVADFGIPDFSTGCAGHKVAALTELPGRPTLGGWLGGLASAAQVALHANTIGALYAAVESGAAIATLPRVLADRRSDFVRLDTPGEPLLLPVRLGVHANLRPTPRIRALIDFIADAVAARRPELNPS
ncbi:MAG: LysR family transcriptional regulator [Terriglobia bacterium]